MDGKTPDSVIRFGSELIIRSIHEEDSNIHVGSLIIYISVGSLINICKPNCDKILSIVLPSIVVMLFLYQLLDFALKSPRSTNLLSQNLAQGFL